ncbi:short-chain alcohol dehydrogenase [Saprospira grandis DSM 2844]|uniref:Short-chain alcohol dehydrogenase n=1 Tax=Saprospira grandis DSM 2844 TaxID=694433 RepID=J0Y0E6_9BACT|nr:SDR family NAD(P)-dependent oxidoreductase [Saprospira grandis]EJF55001.1 short-chain alcohol dehydrogenase [Saprospira grandis DSM 2844]
MPQYQLPVLYVAANSEEFQSLQHFFAGSQVQLVANPSPQQLENSEEKVLLLLSDNFLKDHAAMQALSSLMLETERILPIILNGRQKDAAGNITETPTQTKTIHELMRYRDFWHEEWIRLRKANREAEADELEEIEAKKLFAKRLSTNIGSFLRKINALSPSPWADFEASEFSRLLQAIDITALPKSEEKPAFIEEEIEEAPEAEARAEEEILEEESPEETPLEEKEEEEDWPENSVEEMEEEEKIAAEEEPLEAVEEEKSEEIPTVLEKEEKEEAVAEKVVLEDENLEAAQEYLTEVRSLDALFVIAETETEEADYEVARLAYERILALDPSNGRALIWLARLLDRHFEEEEQQLAQEYYKKAIFVNEESAALYYEYALHLRKRFASLFRVNELLHRALEIDPQYELAYLALADCQAKQGQIEAARANYLQACLLNPELQAIELDQLYKVIRLEEQQALAEELQLPESEEEILPSPHAEEVVFITGATSGIGRATAWQFARAGYRLVLAGRRAARLEQLSEQLHENFEQLEVQTLSFDVRNKAEIDAALAKLPESWGNIDILINNAGLAKGRGPIHEGKIEDWETMIDTNLKGLLYLSRAISPIMVQNKKGFIINIGSIAGKEAYPDGNVYCATKAALDMLTKGMRLDLHRYGVRVAAIHPGHVETEFALVRFDGDEEKAKIYDDFTPLRAEDVAETIFFVASRPERVNIQDLLLFANQQAAAAVIDRSGKKFE